MTTQLMDLDKSALLALDYIRRCGDGGMAGYSTLIGVLPDVSTRQGASSVISRLKKAGYVSVTSEPGNPASVQLTKPGAIRAAAWATTLNSVDGDAEFDDLPAPIDVHYVTVNCKVENGEALPENWRGDFFERHNLEWLYSLQNDSYGGYVPALSRTRVIFYRNSVDIILKGSASGYDPDGVVRQVHERIEDALSWINRRTPVSVSVMRGSVVTTHAALVNEPFAQLVHRLGCDKRDFVVHDRESGRRRIGIEQSGVFPEVECYGADTAVEDLRTAYQDFYGMIAHEPELIGYMIENARELRDGVRDQGDTPDGISNAERTGSNSGEPSGASNGSEYRDDEFMDAWGDRVIW